MGRKAEELGALAVSRLKTPGVHFVGGVAGLAMQIEPTGSRSWILRYMIAGRRRDMGLGGFPDVTLAGARDLAREARAKIKNGVDPIEDGRRARSELKAQRAKNVTFKTCSEDYIEAHSPSWRNAKHRAQWCTSLETYAYPHFGDLLVRDVEVPHILAALKPIWSTKTETATRVRGRIESVLDWATAQEYRAGPNPARWKGHLSHMLAAPRRVAKREHLKALPIDAMGAFLQTLRAVPDLSARALEFGILTAARPGETRGAVWEEIDLKAGVWHIPADRMKAHKEHRVPLSPRAVALLEALPKFTDTNLVFPSPRGKVMSDMTLTALMRRMGAEAVPHGFRSTFRDWAAERTAYPGDMAEMALAHTIADKVEAAYRRGDMFEKRRRMMADWAEFCDKVAPTGGQVVPMRAKSA